MSTAKPIRLGLLAPMTGLVGLYGQEISWAARIAVQQVNETGGILGHPLELIILDDGSIPETAVPAGISLVEDYGCAAIIGNLLSNSRISVVDHVADRYGIPQLNFSFYEGSISSRNFFHFAALPNQQIHKMIPFMVKQFGEKFYFAGSNYEWPLGSIASAKRIVREIKGEIIGEEYLPLGTDKIDQLLDDVARSGADIFVPYFAGHEQINLLTRFHEMGLKQRMKVVMGHYDEAMVGLLSPEIREGFYSSNTYFMSIDTPENAAYKKALAKLKDVSGIWPHGNGVLTNFGEGTFICVHAFAQAANAANCLEPNALIEALEQVKIHAPQGEVSMDAATHHAHVNSYLSRCNGDGEFEIIASFGQTPPMIPARYREEKSSDTSPSGTTSPAQEPPLTAPRTALQEAVFLHSDLAIMVTNDKGHIVDANPAMAQMFGYRADELRDQPMHLLIPPRFRKQHRKHMAGFIESGVPSKSMNKRGSIFGYRKDGSEFPAPASLSRIRNGIQDLVIVTFQDISDQRMAEEKLMWQATHDSLTKLPNRTQITERLNNALQRSQRSQMGVGVLFIDLDDFKLVNDTYGHDVGDQLLVVIAERLMQEVRAGDTVARFGGDEFVIISEQVKDSVAIVNLAERINSALRRPIQIGEHRITSTVSVGVIVSDGHNTAEELLQKSDAAMYSAKDSGRDGWKFYSDELQIKAKKQLDLVNGLRNALEKKEIRMVMQPIIDLRTNRISGAEALMRWTKDGMAISPVDFIPVAESSGMINALGAWSFERSVRVCADWQKRGLLSDDFIFSVNISTRQLLDAAIIEFMDKTLKKHGVNPRHVQLEITETSLMHDIAATRDILMALGEIGLKIAVDDFGTGYSSLAQLARLPVSCLKVDRMFVNDLTENARTRALTDSIISMAHILDLKVVAEGVETREQLEFLKDHDCDSAQGYYFHRPIEIEDCELTWLAAERTPLLTLLGTS